jgi:hypothetical protein
MQLEGQNRSAYLNLLSAAGPRPLKVLSGNKKDTEMAKSARTSSHMQFRQTDRRRILFLDERISDAC